MCHMIYVYRIIPRRCFSNPHGDIIVNILLQNPANDILILVQTIKSESVCRPFPSSTQMTLILKPRENYLSRPHFQPINEAHFETTPGTNSSALLSVPISRENPYRSLSWGTFSKRFGKATLHNRSTLFLATSTVCFISACNRVEEQNIKLKFSNIICDWVWLWIRLILILQYKISPLE